jgi:hypothetical protein
VVYLGLTGRTGIPEKTCVQLPEILSYPKRIL